MRANGESLPKGQRSPRRSLILAGGGLKVAFQAGVLQVWLDEARGADGKPIEFFHADGASGGVFNLAMWCQHMSGTQIADNWRKLRPLRGLSLNWREWVPLPASLLDYRAFAQNVLNGAWRLDWHRIRTTDRQATFNLFNVDRQEHVERTPAEMDQASLISAVSLPWWFSAVPLADGTYIDAVYATDANLERAIKLGADELWVIWTVSRRGRWQRGPIAHYFQTIEAAANSRVNAVLERIARNNAAEEGRGEFGRHIEVKWLSAEVPLHYVLNFTREGMAEAVERGVVQARKWCGHHRIRVEEVPAAKRGGKVTFRETMTGAFAFGYYVREETAENTDGTDTKLTARLEVTIPDVEEFAAEPCHVGELRGIIECDALGGSLEVTGGEVELFWDRGDVTHKRLTYRIYFTDGDGQVFTLVGGKFVVNDPGLLDVWTDTTTLYIHLYRGLLAAGESIDAFVGAGVLRISVRSFLRQLTTFRGEPAPDGSASAAKSVLRFGRFMARQIAHVYAQPPGPEVPPQFVSPRSPASSSDATPTEPLLTRCVPVEP